MTRSFSRTIKFAVYGAVVCVMAEMAVETAKSDFTSTHEIGLLSTMLSAEFFVVAQRKHMHPERCLRSPVASRFDMSEDLRQMEKSAKRIFPFRRRHVYDDKIVNRAKRIINQLDDICAEATAGKGPNSQL